MDEKHCMNFLFIDNLLSLVEQLLIVFDFYSPCFDEPALKATFDITIEHPDNTNALSNWNEIVYF